MGWLNLYGLIAVVLFVAWAFWRVSRLGSDAPAGRRRGPSGVRGVVPICSDGELAFLAVLESVVPDGMRVLCKVRVADAIETFGTDFRTIAQKHFDFVVCDAESLMPMLAIELDDKSRLTATAQRSDAVKDAVCATAGLRILRVKARASYDGLHLARCIAVASADRNQI